MGILTSFQVAIRDRVLVVIVALLMSLGGLLIMLDFNEVSAAPEDAVPTPLVEEQTIGPSVRSGDTYLQSSPPEYLIEGKTSSGYFGNVMVKLDFNGDGYEDLAVGQPRRYKVCIYDGKTQLEYPSLYETDTTARWIISDSSYFGSDISTGDINGDGYDDLLVSRAYSTYAYDYLYYGGPSRDSQTAISYSQFDASIRTYQYAGKTNSIGDIDGDGYDDILTVSSASSASYSGIYVWYGSSSFSGYKYENSANVRIRGFYYMGSGGVETGDMNGDGKDEIVIGSPYYSGGRVDVMISKGTSRPTGHLYIGSSYTTCEWATYRYSNAKYFGYYNDIVDIDGDGYEDLICAGSTAKKIFIVDGSASLDTGNLYFTSTSTYDRDLTASSVSEFGSFAFGDYNNDGKTDMAAGGHGAGKVFILDNSIINGTTGSINAESKANWTIHQPSGSRYFAYTGYYYYYYSNPHYKTLCFWDRNNDGYEDIFISDPQKTTSGGTYAGAIYGVSPKDMAGLGDFAPPEGDLPDGETFYAEYKPYTFSVIVWNNWAPTADTIGMEIEMGSENVEIGWNAVDGLMEVNDPTDLIRLDIDNYQFIVDNVNSQVELKFNLTFTLNLDYECDLNIFVYATMAHLYFSDEAYMGKLRNTFMFVGELESYIYDEGTGGRGDPLPTGSWMPENAFVELTGMKIVYNGTQDFLADHGEEPFHPSNDLFYIEIASNLGDEATDMDSSGTEFDIVIPARDKPMLVTFDTYAMGIPERKIISGVPQFYVNVDLDVPSKPVGLSIHADGFTDPQKIVDNEGELFVTWSPAGEFGSGLDYYEVKINGDDQTIMIIEETYTKINTTAVGNVYVEIRAVDNVGHIGPWGMASILIDDKLLNFTNFRPSSDTWLNTMIPDVYITIDDDGGRAIMGSTVEYSLSYDNGETYSNWIDAGQVLEAKVLDVRIKPNLMEGDANYIMFRASDEAGNIKESDSYQIMVDTSSVVFGDLLIEGDTAWSGDWIDSGEVEASIELGDIYSGVDASSIEYRYTVRGRGDLDTTLWMPYEGSFANGIVTVDMMFEEGDRNFIQYRARDLVGNPLSYSPAFNVWVNTNPYAVIESPEDGMEVLEGEVFVFDGTGSFDYDGDVLEYVWMDTWTSGEETQDIILGEDEEDPLRFQAVLQPGTHSIVLILKDGIHETESMWVNVTVLAREEPIWMYSDLDSDGDGMNNLWEYIYHLPWEEDSVDNGGSEVTETNDFDGDGHTDLVEFQQGTNPTNILDFPIEVGTGEERDESNIDWIIFILILLAILIVLFAIIFMMANYFIVRAKVSSNAEKEAKEQEVLTQNALDGGGLEKLQALKAASEGKVMPGLPMGMAVPDQSQALPEGPVGEQPAAQPMTAAPVGEPAAAEPAPAPAPMAAQPVDSTYGGYNPPAQ